MCSQLVYLHIYIREGRQGSHGISLPIRYCKQNVARQPCKEWVLSFKLMSDFSACVRDTHCKIFLYYIVLNLDLLTLVSGFTLRVDHFQNSFAGGVEPPLLLKIQNLINDSLRKKQKRLMFNECLISDKDTAKLYVWLQLPHVKSLASIPHPPKLYVPPSLCVNEL